MKESVFQGRSLLAEKDFTKRRITIFDRFFRTLERLEKRGIPHHYLEGKNIALLFEKHLHVLVLHLLLQRSI